MPNFCQNSSINHKNIAICRILKMAIATILIFKFAKFYWLTGSRGPRWIIRPNFVKIRQCIAEILQFFNFSIFSAAMLDFQSR